MKRKILTTAAAIVCLFANLNAQQAYTSAQPVQLTLGEAIDIALNDNPTIKIADLEIERQDYVRKETVGNLLPSLSATGSYNYSIVKQSMSRSGLSFGADNTITGTASLSLPLFVPAVYANLQLNRTQMESAVESARSSKINLVNEVKKAYYNILLGQESLDVLYASEKMIQETVDNAQVMFDNGLASEYDLLTAQVQLSNLKPNIIQTENAVEIGKLMLKMLLSIPQDVDIEISGNLIEYSDALIGSGVALTTEVENNSDLRMLDIQRKLLENQVKLINTQRMPTIAAFGQATITGNDMPDLSFSSMMGGDGVTINPGDYPNISLPLLGDMMKLFGDIMGGSSTPSTPSTGFWWQNPVTVGVQISIPIFSGNKNVNQARQVRNNIKQLDLQRDYVEENITLLMKSSINNIFAAREKMYANEKTIASAQKAYDISKVRYTAGAGSMLELNNAELQLTQAKLSHSQAIYEHLAAQADYEKNAGMEY